MNETNETDELKPPFLYCKECHWLGCTNQPMEFCPNCSDQFMCDWLGKSPSKQKLGKIVLKEENVNT